MRAADFEPTSDGAASFVWLLGNGTHPNEEVRCAGSRDSAGHLARIYGELLAYAKQVEAERDRWQSIAMKLADVGTP